MVDQILSLQEIVEIYKYLLFYSLLKTFYLFLLSWKDLKSSAEYTIITKEEWK